MATATATSHGMPGELSPTSRAADQPAYAATVKNAPCAKLSTRIKPQMSESPAAMRKYSAPRPSPVMSSSAIVVTRSVAPDRGEPEMLARERRIAHQLLDLAGERDTALVQHNDVVHQAVRDAQVLLHQQDRRNVRGAAQRVDDVPDDERCEALRRFVDEQDAVVGVQQRTRQRDHLLLPAGERG